MVYSSHSIHVESIYAYVIPKFSDHFECVTEQTLPVCRYPLMTQSIYAFFPLLKSQIQHQSRYTNAV